MNKKTYSAPKTELVSVAYATHLLTQSVGEDWDADAKENNFMKPAGGEGDNTNWGNYNPWSTWDEK